MAKPRKIFNAVTLAGMSVPLGIIGVLAYNGTRPAQAETVYVNDKAVVSATQKVYTDKGAFNVMDSPFRLHFNHQSVYGLMNIGCTYRVSYTPAAVGLGNILEATHVPTPECPQNRALAIRLQR